MVTEEVIIDMADAVEVGVVLPNTGPEASLPNMVRNAHAARDAGFGSLWLTDHLLVGEDAAASYGRVVEPLTASAYLAGRMGDVGLGTSILLLPLRHPVAVAKQAALVQAGAGRGFRMGVGVGWHEPEFRMLGYGFADRGRRANEALRLIRSLWRGERDFHGEYWSFEEAAFGPLPDPPPQIWVGGASPAARRRAERFGDAWHPVNPSPADVRSFRRATGLPVRPRLLVFIGEDGPDWSISGSPATLAAHLQDLIESGVDAITVSLENPHTLFAASMRRFRGEVLARVATR